MLVEGKDVTVSGGFRKIAKLRAEYYEYAEDPRAFAESMKAAGVRADIFSWLQKTVEREPRGGWYHEPESISVIPLTTYEHWWKKQLNDKTRNMIRKAGKAGVETRIVPFDDKLVQAIVDLYNENPMRQGKPFAHYGKDFATIKRDHESYPERSVFIGAFHGEQMIGFIKLVHGDGVSNLMQILSMISQRDKAPTNALISKAVELCCERGVKYLHYGLWSKRGLGDFKKHHRFEQYDVVRYFMPLTAWGRFLLALRLHKRLPDYVPEKWHDSLVNLRTWWNNLRHARRAA